MRIIAAENIPNRTINALRDLGHSVPTVRSSFDKDAADDCVWDIDQSEAAILITTDKGFVHRGMTPHHGVLMERLCQPNRARSRQHIMRAFAHFAESSWPGQTVVIRDRAKLAMHVRTGTRQCRVGDPLACSFL